MGARARPDFVRADLVRPDLVRTLLLLLATLSAIVGLDHLRAALAARVHKVRETADVYALPPPEYVKVASLGYRDAVASVLWASTLYQYGDHVSHNQRFEYPTQYIETILTLDPAFRPAYKFLSTLTTMQVVAPSRAQLEEVRRLLQTGVRELPSDADVWGAYASFMMFEGAQFLEEHEKQRWRVAGAKAAQRAVELGYFMDTLSLTGAIFLERAGERDLAIAQLERAYALAPNDETRERIASKLRKLRAQDVVARVEGLQRAMINLWLGRFPWLSESMLVVVGPPRDVAGCAGLVGTLERCTPGWPGFTAAP
ncbi:MAG: hypothetical protein HYV09_09020 [Deltaproteobacteria bacterium]|nr:hypothetical protein [Deltaproteobacteria bacterium]